MKAISKVIIFIVAVTLFSCAKDNSNDTGDDNHKANPVFSVKLVDAPSAFDAVNVEILYMKARIDSTWIDFPVENPGVYNLQEFTNGNSMVLIGDTSVAPGIISELRLVLGDNNSVVVDGVSYELQTPSGQSSGYKIKMDPQPLEADGLYRLVIDFDVSRSVHRTGNGKYMLRPVCNGYLETAVGGIAGVVFPASGAYFAEAVNLTDTASTLIDQSSGEFLLGTVFPGTYAVTCYSSDTNYADFTLTGVQVMAGQVTQLDTIYLAPASK
jgi:hypothetical protein